MLCAIDGCTRQARYRATGWCQTHYHRWWRNGSTDPKPPAQKDPYTLRYRTVHTRVADLWGHAGRYPCVLCGHQADEWAYDGHDPTEKHETLVGRWPVVFSVHPEFYFPACIPCHRKMDGAARAARRTHCVHGHEMTDENTYRPHSRPGNRECRTCRAGRYVPRKEAA